MITPDGAQEIIWYAKDQTQVGSLQNKHSILCIVALNLNHFFLMINLIIHLQYDSLALENKTQNIITQVEISCF